MKRMLLMLPLALLACGEDGPPVAGKVHERLYREAFTSSELQAKYDYMSGDYRLVSVDVHHPEKFLLDIVDEHGKEHRVTIPESVWANCEVDEWYSPRQGGGCS